MRLAIGFLLITFFSCSGTPNKLNGHKYMVKPLNTLMQMRLGFGMINIVHEYKSNRTVEISTFVGKEATKKERQSYLIKENTYSMDGEVYDLSFQGDTAILSINGDKVFELQPIK